MALRGEGEAIEDLVRQYLREIGDHALLTPAEEIVLATAMQQGRDAAAVLDAAGDDLGAERLAQLRGAVEAGAEARRRFINANLRLVVSIAKRYQAPGFSLLDLVQEGNLGLMRAVEKFDGDRGCRFSTYATWWVRQAISRAIADKGRAIRLPAHMGETTRRVRKARARLYERLGREATTAEIAAACQLPEAVVADVANIVEDPVSMNASVDDGIEVGDLVADESVASPVDHVHADAVRRELHRALAVLNQREREVIQLRFGIGGAEPRTLEDVGRTFRVTRERVRQIEAKALTKLRHPATPPWLRSQPPVERVAP